VESMIYLDKFDILRSNLSNCIVDFVQSGPVSYESGCLRRSDGQSAAKTLESLCQFMSHLHSQSITFSGDQTDKLENYIADSILRPSIPLEIEEDDEAFADVKKLFQLSLKISPNFKKIPKMAQNLSSDLAEKSSARLLTRYRRILSTDDFMSTITPSSQKRYLSHKSPKQTSVKLSLTTQLKVQNPESPISPFCAQGWLIMLKNPNLALRIIQLYKVYVYNRFSPQLAENMEFVNILSNDIDWFVGCLARLHLAKSSEKLTTTRACFDQVLSLKAILARFEKYHLDKVEVEIDSLIDEKLRLVSKIEDAQLDPYLAPLAKRKLLERSSIYFINKITGAILAEEDIAVDACTPLDTFVNKVSDLPGYPSTNAEDLRFVLRSSLSDIVGVWKTGDITLSASDVRGLIRALFSNTSKRSDALQKII